MIITACMLCPHDPIPSSAYSVRLGIGPSWGRGYYLHYTNVGSAMTEILKKKVITPIETCWVESGFCAFLVLRYDDPENPKLEALNSVNNDN